MPSYKEWYWVDLPGGAPRLRLSLQGNMEETREFRVVGGTERLDKYLVRHLEDISRSQIQHLIRERRVAVDGVVVKPSYLVSPGEVIRLVLPPPEEGPVAEELPLNIVYEDDQIVVLNKLAGMVVHPAAGRRRGTLVNALLARYPHLYEGGKERPGIVHRLDKDTSGLLVVAKVESAKEYLQDQFKRGQVHKVYLTLARGKVEPQRGIVEAPIGRDPYRRQRMAVVRGGREARTEYRVCEHLGDYTYLEVTPKTGRTHQVRVHLAFIGHPVAGDRVYGFKGGDIALNRQFLHAHILGFRLPANGKYVEFEADLPLELKRVLEELRGGAR